MSQTERMLHDEDFRKLLAHPLDPWWLTEVRWANADAANFWCEEEELDEHFAGIREHEAEMRSCRGDGD